MEELAQPRDTFILERGQYDKPGEKVGPGVPASLPPLPSDSGTPNRLALARWLVAPGHPLVGRVTVNRYWQMFFGTGNRQDASRISARRANCPSHPALLDWLAVTFVSPDVGSALGRQGAAPADRHLGDLPPGVGGHGVPRREGPGEPAPGPRAAAPAPGRVPPRPGAGDQRAARRPDRRRERLALPARRALGGADLAARRRQLLGASLQPEPRRRPLPADDVHVLEADLAPSAH